ncbi:MAG: hypothetical protein OXN27_17515 [Candidatus Poribacteria bacterium]|nr:hypothetical protein [Candidatus Poribacteria bacterium]
MTKTTFNPTRLELQLRKAGVYLLKILLCVGLFIGCGSDMDEEPPPPEPAVLVRAIPRDGDTIPANGEIALEFNKRPENLNTIPPRIFYFADEVDAKVKRNISGLLLAALPRKDRTVIIFPFPIVVPIKVFWGHTVPQQSVTLTYRVVAPH